MKCPWCDRLLEIVKKEINDKVVIHECRKCGNIVGAYWKEMEEYLVGFFNRHTLDTFKPEPTIKKE